MFKTDKELGLRRIPTPICPQCKKYPLQIWGGCGGCGYEIEDKESPDYSDTPKTR